MLSITSEGAERGPCNTPPEYTHYPYIPKSMHNTPISPRVCTLPLYSQRLGTEIRLTKTLSCIKLKSFLGMYN